MHISQRGVDFIKGFEGFSAHQYDDGTGVMTIGYGTTTSDIRPLPRHLSEREASKLLARKLEEKYAPAVNALHLPLAQNQFDALVSLVYNLGTGILASSHDIGRFLRQKRWDAAANAFLEYDHAGGQRMLGLTRRRQAERLMFLRSAPDPQAFVPKDEALWVATWDKLRGKHSPGAHIRRVRLKRKMIARKHEIYLLAVSQTAGWGKANRAARFHALNQRTNG